MAILKNLTQEAQELERLRSELATLKASKVRSTSLKVSDKGGVSFYGLGRFPVTLYKEQWERLLDHKELILEFIEANASRLKTKEEG